MIQPIFQAGDKVVLVHESCSTMATVPKLKAGTVYCVERVTISEPTKFFPPHQRLHLCGVRLHKRMKKPAGGLPWAAFRQVGPAQKEEA